MLLAAAMVAGAAEGPADSAAATAPRKDPAAAPLAQAGRLQARWRHCEGRATVVATRSLARARATKAPRPRLTRARTALRQWHAVARGCVASGDGAPITVGRGAFLPSAPDRDDGREGKKKKREAPRR